MKLRLTKTNKIVFALLIVVLSSALGFLVWRVNQQDEPITPMDSEAASGECPGDPTYVIPIEGAQVCGLGCLKKDPAVVAEVCPNLRNLQVPWPSTIKGTYTIKGVVGRGHLYDDGDCQCQNCEEFKLVVDGVDSLIAKDVSVKSGANCGLSSKETCTADGGVCPRPTDFAHQDLGQFVFDGTPQIKIVSTAPSCVDDGSEYVVSPVGSWAPNSVQLLQLCLYAVPECGNSILDEGEECDPPGSSCTAGGGQTGTCSNECKCSVNPYCGDGKLDSNEQCEDGDPSGVQCIWSACNQDTCTCLTAGLNISKSVVERCIGDGTEDPVSELTYTVRVQNTGAGVGRVSKIEDDLDSKVSSSPSGITSPGQYSSGKILWDYTSSPLEIAANSTKTFTYKLSIDKSKFGTYSNTVTLTPVEGDTLKATASISADCEIAEPQTPPPPEPPPPPPGEPQPEETIPETGIFDSTLGRVGVGILLVIFGYIVYIIPNRTIHLLGKHPNKRVRSKFEQKVLKKDS